MRVYRAETKPFGDGPYTLDCADPSYKACMAICWAHNNEDRPTPREDPDLGIPEWDVEFCGLDSPANFLEWFEEEVRELMEDHFIVSVYEIDNARVGMMGQVLFERCRAEYLTSYRISEFVAECKQLA